MNPCHKHNTLVSSYYCVMDWMCVCSPNSYIKTLPLDFLDAPGAQSRQPELDLWSGNQILHHKQDFPWLK